MTRRHSFSVMLGFDPASTIGQESAPAHNTNNPGKTVLFQDNRVKLYQECGLKILAAIAKWVFVLCIPLLLLTGSIGIAANSLQLYKYGFEKYDIRASTGLDSVQLDKAAHGLISYFNSDEELIGITVSKDGASFPLFNEREVIHLKDVKDLFQLDYRVLGGTLIYTLGFAALYLFRHSSQVKRRQLAWAVASGGGLTLALMVGLGAIALLNFDQFFLQFHLISFANDFWQLDSARDYLIMLFPQGFWFDATMLCAGIVTAAAVLLGAGSTVYLRRCRELA